MKQRIEASQLQELTPEQQEKLRAWWKPRQGDLFTSLDSSVRVKYVIDVDKEGYIYGGRDWHPKSECLPLLNIGQMLQLIDESGFYARYQYMVGHSRNSCLPSDFCDQLWNDVREIL